LVATTDLVEFKLSDIDVMRADGTGKRLVLRNATDPSWRAIPK
jgi:hypothetical protein